MKLVSDINKNIFRQYDIRGIYGEDLNEDVAYTLGRSYGSYIKKFNQNTVVVGHDNRTSSPILSNALIKGLLESGANVINVGLVTTPMLYFSRIHFKTPTGIMITASHNPSEYNGFKISFEKIGNACGQAIQDFYEFTAKLEFDSGKGILKEENVKELYINEIKNSIDIKNSNMRCVVDVGNGTSSIVVKDVFNRLGITCDVINVKEDLSIPSDYLDPSVKELMQPLAEYVKQGGYDIGIGLDGDADRVGIVDENGNIISADQYMIVMYNYLNKQLKNRKALFDVKCSMSLIEELKKLDIEPIMYRTGNSYINAMMQEGNFDFGGEFSGHLFFRDKWLGFDDGLYNGLRMIEFLEKSNTKINDILSKVNKYYATDEIKFKVTEENKFKIIDEIKEIAINNNYKIIDIDGVRITFDHFWILIRASNTGPNLTMRIEANNLDLLNSIKEKATEDLNNLINNFSK